MEGGEEKGLPILGTQNICRYFLICKKNITHILKPLYISIYVTIYFDILYHFVTFSAHFEGCVLHGRSGPHEEQLSPKRVVIDVAEVLRRGKGFDEGPSKVKVPEANPLLDVYPNAFGKLDVTVVKFFIFSRHSNLELGTWNCDVLPPVPLSHEAQKEGG